MYGYGLIGNCQLSALSSITGSIDWLCLPRPDSDPIFGRLLDTDGGHFSITSAEGHAKAEQYYRPNTNVLVTEIEDPSGSRFRITDFSPRFEQYGRMYRPASLFRIVERVSGTPNIRVSCKPVTGWDKKPVMPVRGNSHLLFEIRGEALRLTTNMPLTYLSEEASFALEDKLYFGLSWGSPIEEDIVAMTERFLLQTTAWWRTWVKHCSIPTRFQRETIRSALALKLHCYEDTGAILAALTTSLPEEMGKIRNWDYRYCWLRDAHFVLTAFRNLGHFEEMEGFLKFFLGIAHKHEASRDRLAPVYTLSQGLPIPETEQPLWHGFVHSGPVRTNNQAAEHIQNDVYGEMILTLAPIYFDERFFHLRTQDHEALLAYLAHACERSISTPDAGLWETRNGWREHSFTNLMSWAGLDRIAKIQERGFLKELPLNVPVARDRALSAVVAAAPDGCLCNGPKDESLDAALALASVLRVPEQNIARTTVQRIRDELSLGAQRPGHSFFHRYIRLDDFGRPSSAFVICSFWVAQALARHGQIEDARQIIDDASRAANHVGLLSEHFLPDQNLQSGNFPQAYSHVGLINAAFAASPSWDEVL